MLDRITETDFVRYPLPSESQTSQDISASQNEESIAPIFSSKLLQKWQIHFDTFFINFPLILKQKQHHSVVRHV